MKKPLLLFVLLLLPFMANAYDFESGGLYFNIISTSEKTVEITYGDNFYSFNEISLPSVANYKNIDFNVVGIGANAFRQATFRGITIPNSIKTIASRAFENTYHESIPNYIYFEGDITIDSEAFWCAWNMTFIFTSPKTPTLHDTKNRGYLFNADPTMCVPEGANKNDFLSFAQRGQVVFYESSLDISVLKSLGLCSLGLNTDDFSYKVTNLTQPYSAMLVKVKRNDKNITLPSSTQYGDIVFQIQGTGENIFSNNNVETLIIPDGYVAMNGSIGECSSLKKVSLPSTIEQLTKTFVGCSNLDCVESNIVNPFETDAFNTNIISLFTTLYVPDNSVEKYQSTAPWNQFKSVLPISEATNINQTLLHTAIMKCKDGKLNVEGVNDGQTIELYSLKGEKRGSAVSKNGVAYIDTSIQPGSVAIVKIGNKSVKIVIK